MGTLDTLLYANMRPMMKSKITGIQPSKRNDGSFYGFIRSLDDGQDYYFTTYDVVSDLPEGRPITRDVCVEFEPVEGGNGRKASNVRVIQSGVDRSALIKQDKQKMILPSVKTTQAQPITRFEDLKAGVLSQVEILSSITDPYLFEDGVFLLLRLLGIHTAYQYPRSQQRGEADGFFMIESLAVMDCTLEDEFETKKQTQMENFRNRLSQETQLTFNFRKTDGGIGKKKVPLPGKKQVWIITRGTTRELEDFGGIKVKEIAVADLCKVLDRRLHDIAYDGDRLATDLTLIGNA